eukprot:CAMPEP_0117689742 /NCGR_PEP_ID=MMETSP0804-20121206/24695_1 /TAXON_ID=1074897 /ORGANISM="Tetraselmis astigmatica, Strain CCMP880" /LENGTH=63 /DNA_ID=CAMNT_0005502621 /DNA_START=305 /DNA_END=497 /DNA_ORIENTATION=+
MQPLLDVGPGGVAPRLPEVEGPRAAQRQRGDALAVPMRTDLVTVPWMEPSGAMGEGRFGAPRM